MPEDMPRERTPEEVRRLKEQGIIDVGTYYQVIGGWDRLPVHKFWDGYVPPPQKRRKGSETSG